MTTLEKCRRKRDSNLVSFTVKVDALTTRPTRLFASECIWRVPEQNGISQAFYVVEIYHSGVEPSICDCLGCLFFLIQP